MPLGFPVCGSVRCLLPPSASPQIVRRSSVRVASNPFQQDLAPASPPPQLPARFRTQIQVGGLLWKRPRLERLPMLRAQRVPRIRISRSAFDTLSIQSERRHSCRARIGRREGRRWQEPMGIKVRPIVR